jgi:hypothetical protein
MFEPSDNIGNLLCFAHSLHRLDFYYGLSIKFISRVCSSSTLPVVGTRETSDSFRPAARRSVNRADTVASFPDITKLSTRASEIIIISISGHWLFLVHLTAKTFLPTGCSIGMHSLLLSIQIVPSI